MVKVCVFPTCKNKQIKKDESFSHIQFHSFPLHRTEVLRRWVEAVGRGESWTPGRASRICSVHFAEDCFKDTSGPRRLLHPDAVPTIYNGASSSAVSRAGPGAAEKVFTVPTKLQMIRSRFSEKLKDLRRKNKMLKLRLLRRDSRIKELKNRMSSLRNLIERKTKISIASDRLEGFARELLDHSIKNSDTKRTGIRYSPSLREFALTLYLHSPRAYLYVRSLLRLLPNPSLIKKWIANFNRPPPNSELCIMTTENVVNECTDVTTTEELIIEDIDSFIVIEDPVDIQSCITGVANGSAATVESIPVMVAQHVQIQ